MTASPKVLIALRTARAGDPESTTGTSPWLSCSPPSSSQGPFLLLCPVRFAPAPPRYLHLRPVHPPPDLPFPPSPRKPRGRSRRDSKSSRSYRRIDHLDLSPLRLFPHPACRLPRLSSCPSAISR
ncbi:hypothetical protein VTN02DRAFT_5359 [Thermoascus thermophilus]